jgi:exopolysaccharide production protein ExoQ
MAPGRVLVTTIALSVAVGILLESGGGLAASVGRDTTLTGRTQLWNDVLKLTVDPLFGTGFESFWLGERVERIWKLYWWRPNQSHNGYIELFLNLGATGLTFLAAAIVLSYRKIGQSFRAGSDAAKLRLAYLVVAIVFNLTEAAFKGFHPVWIAFLFAVTDAPASRPPQRDADSVDIAKSTGARLEVPVGG